MTVVPVLVLLPGARASASSSGSGSGCGSGSGSGSGSASASASAIDKVVLRGSRWNPLLMLRGAGAVVEVSHEEKRTGCAPPTATSRFFSFPTLAGLPKQCQEQSRPNPHQSKNRAHRQLTDTTSVSHAGCVGESISEEAFEPFDQPFVDPFVNP